jgi:hypothetical protein
MSMTSAAATRIQAMSRASAMLTQLAYHLTPEQ